MTALSLPIVFQSRALPDRERTALRSQLREEHRREPLSSVDPRSTVRRVAAIAARLHLDTTVYRGGVDLRGSEATHVWLAVHHPDAPGEPCVVDAAFPLFSIRFREVLARFVAGDARQEALEEAGLASSLDDRVIGLIPSPVRYVGRPVWSAQRGAGPG